MAEALLRKLLAEKLGCNPTDLADRGYLVESAGTGAYAGSPANPAAVDALSDMGLDISTHRSQPLNLYLASRADYIYVMTADHARIVAALGAGVADRVRTLDEEDIEDPIGGDKALYRRCAERIENALRNRLKEIVL